MAGPAAYHPHELTPSLTEPGLPCSAGGGGRNLVPEA